MWQGAGGGRLRFSGRVRLIVVRDDDHGIGWRRGRGGSSGRSSRAGRGRCGGHCTEPVGHSVQFRSKAVTAVKLETRFLAGRWQIAVGGAEEAKHPAKVELRARREWLDCGTKLVSEGHTIGGSEKVDQRFSWYGAGLAQLSAGKIPPTVCRGCGTPGCQGRRGHVPSGGM